MASDADEADSILGPEGSLTYRSEVVEMGGYVSGDEAHIGHLYVAKDARQSGVASDFFHTLFEELRDRGVSQVTASIALTDFDPDEHNVDDYIIGDEFFQDPTVNFLDYQGFSGFDPTVHGKEKIVVRDHRFL